MFCCCCTLSISIFVFFCEKMSSSLNVYLFIFALVLTDKEDDSVCNGPCSQILKSKLKGVCLYFLSFGVSPRQKMIYFGLQICTFSATNVIFKSMKCYQLSFAQSKKVYFYLIQIKIKCNRTIKIFLENRERVEKRKCSFKTLLLKLQLETLLEMIPKLRMPMILHFIPTN